MMTAIEKGKASMWELKCDICHICHIWLRGSAETS